MIGPCGQPHRTNGRRRAAFRDSARGQKIEFVIVHFVIFLGLNVRPQGTNKPNHRFFEGLTEFCEGEERAAIRSKILWGLSQQVLDALIFALTRRSDGHQQPQELDGILFPAICSRQRECSADTVLREADL
ncbi:MULTISPECIES: hypothetical protein [unclassified Bradyrhizobium]